MLCQVERGETSPTLQVAARIAAGLELRLSQLLRLDEDGAVTIVRAGERPPRRRRRRGHRYEVLTAAAARPARRALAPRAGARRRDRRPGRPADARARQPRDRARRVAARVVLHFDGAAHELHAGDCVTFDADLPHHFENPGPEEEAVLLAIVSAGLRRS